ncbi:MAG: DUF1501 domain-containing protein [Pirellulaceae bacterium]|jgi:hypothetical protein|nr:DUF1501 domain-containing protein [Pirellulaceae bacterium]
MLTIAPIEACRDKDDDHRCHLLPVRSTFATLLQDLEERGLLDQTLVTSEMGRTPKIGDPRSGGCSKKVSRCTCFTATIGFDQ